MLQPQHTSTSAFLLTSARSWKQSKPTHEQLLDKHKEPFKSIAKSTTDVSLMTIGVIIADFKDII
jgi:hypothetical protein